jgi:hypothetical protein
LIKLTIGAGQFLAQDTCIDTARRVRNPRRALLASGWPNRYVQPELFVGDGVNSRRSCLSTTSDSRRFRHRIASLWPLRCVSFPQVIRPARGVLPDLGKGHDV